MQTLKTHFEQTLNTTFEALNQDVFFSKDKALYLRSCKNKEAIESTKMQMSFITEQRKENSVIWVEDGYNEDSKKYYILYK